jgi:hypothetical protein
MKNLVNTDSQTYRARYLGLSLSWPKGINAQSIPKDTVRLRVQYLLDRVVHQQLNIHQSAAASDTDETSYGAVSGEKHGRTLIELFVF